MLFYFVENDLSDTSEDTNASEQQDKLESKEEHMKFQKHDLERTSPVLYALLAEAKTISGELNEIFDAFSEGRQSKILFFAAQQETNSFHKILESYDLLRRTGKLARDLNSLMTLQKFNLNVEIKSQLKTILELDRFENFSPKDIPDYYTVRGWAKKVVGTLEFLIRGYVGKTI